MRRGPGRPKTLKAKEVKKPYPMRFSEAELALFKKMAGEMSVREWIRTTLLTPNPTSYSVEAIAAWAKAHPELATDLKKALGNTRSKTDDSNTGA